MKRSKASHAMLKVVKAKELRDPYPRNRISFNGWIERYMDQTSFGDNPRFRSHLDITAERTGVPVEKVEFVIKHFFIHLIYGLLIATWRYSRFVLPDCMVIHKNPYTMYNLKKKVENEQSSDADNDGKGQ